MEAPLNGLLIIVNKFSALTSNIKIYRRDCSNYNESSFIEDVRSEDWEHTFSCTSTPTNMLDVFVDKNSHII